MAEPHAKSLLVELFVEELPPKALQRLGEAFAQGLTAALAARRLLAPDSATTGFATPRRLAARITGVLDAAADEEVLTKLMPASVAFDGEGRPTEALRKRAGKLGREALVDRWSSGTRSVEEGADRLFIGPDGKGESVFLRGMAKGARLQAGLEASLEAALEALPIDKVMQYQLADGWTSVSFVRPAHGLVALHGEAVVPVRALGLVAGRSTVGHRFEAAVSSIELKSAQSYEQQLRDEGAVIAGFAARRAEIVRQLDAAAATAGLRAIDDDALLDEVTALVERPNVLACRFEEEFLAVPPECLVLTMKANQKYFPLLDASGALTNRFLVVSNIAPADPSRVVEGNERVVRPRLADAKFFFDQDRRRSLESRVPGLDKVVYHGKLGSQGDRVRRLRRIARWVASQIGADVDAAERAALLAKADLLTDMVGEFPELQGVMGGYYAAHDGEAADVAAAIRGQYENRRGDSDADTATNLVGEALLIADRAEALVGIWSVGGKPTGEKDPYAMRRHALTLIRSFQRVAGSSATPRLELRGLLEQVASTFGPMPDPQVVADVEVFVYERYFQQLASLYDTRAVDAVLSLRPPLHDAVARLLAVRDFLAVPEAPALAAANKRVGNILKKSADVPGERVDPTLLTEPAERDLAAALADVGARADDAYARGRYDESLRLLAGLKLPVDAFFDQVMVNVEARDVRANRLALLAILRTTMNRVADLSRLAQ